MKFFKQLIAKVEKEDNRVISFVGTTDVVDRDREILTSDGWDIKNYMKNPVFLWAHKYGELPVGKAIKVTKNKEKGMIFKIEFATEEMNPQAERVYKMYKDNFLNAVSVGFDMDWKDREVDEVNRVVYLRKKELLELSAVPVPANPQALQLSAEKGGIEKYLKGCEKHHFEYDITDFNYQMRISDLDKTIFIMGEQIKKMQEMKDDLDNVDPEIHAIECKCAACRSVTGNPISKDDEDEEDIEPEPEETEDEPEEEEPEQEDEETKSLYKEVISMDALKANKPIENDEVDNNIRKEFLSLNLGGKKA